MVGSRIIFVESWLKVALEPRTDLPHEAAGLGLAWVLPGQGASALRPAVLDHLALSRKPPLDSMSTLTARPRRDKCSHSASIPPPSPSVACGTLSVHIMSSASVHLTCLLWSFLLAFSRIAFGAPPSPFCKPQPQDCGTTSFALCPVYRWVHQGPPSRRLFVSGLGQGRQALLVSWPCR